LELSDSGHPRSDVEGALELQSFLEPVEQASDDRLTRNVLAHASLANLAELEGAPWTVIRSRRVREE